MPPLALAVLPCPGVFKKKKKNKKEKRKKKPILGKPEAATQIMIIPVKV